MKNSSSENSPWFAAWFDTSYYHLLYQNRDENEAKYFITNLIKFLKLSNEYVLDLACGKGRHSKFLQESGLKVLGVDLSPKSIASAQQYSNDQLSFRIHDMREVVENECFEVVFNLFTSFGYFEDDSENHKVLKSVHQMLNENGILVIDFMNCEKVIKNLVLEEKKTIDNIDFFISRGFNGSHIVKDINFSDNGNKFSYSEKVRAFKLSDFEGLLVSNGFKIMNAFGDFGLNNFNHSTSDRLILVAQKV
jgi:SAM-dependent methyltransferase